MRSWRPHRRPADAQIEMAADGDVEWVRRCGSGAGVKRLLAMTREWN